MAATAVYVSIDQIQNYEGKVTPAAPVQFSNIGSTSAAFTLPAGKYNVTCKGSTYGTVTLKKLALDGSTYVTVLTAFSADGAQTVDLSRGTYQVVLA